jgi:hypothetical protein
MLEVEALELAARLRPRRARLRRRQGRAGVARRRALARCVVQTGDEAGQHKVNKLAPENPNRSEPIRLNHAARPAVPSRHKSLASTLNPKVEGSNPSRPMRFAGKVPTREAHVVAARVTRTVQRDFADSPPARASDHDPISWFAALSSPGEAEIDPQRSGPPAPKAAIAAPSPSVSRRR